MAGLYENFEKRFADKFFSAGWIEVQTPTQEQKQEVVAKKDLKTLEAELAQINETIESISFNQLRLSNLAKLYE